VSRAAVGQSAAGRFLEGSLRRLISTATHKRPVKSYDIAIWNATICRLGRWAPTWTLLLWFLLAHSGTQHIIAHFRNGSLQAFKREVCEWAEFTFHSHLDGHFGEESLQDVCSLSWWQQEIDGGLPPGWCLEITAPRNRLYGLLYCIISVVCCTATSTATVTVAATDIDNTVTESSVSADEPSATSSSYRQRHCSPHPYPHLASKLSSSSAAGSDVDGNIVAADMTDTVVSAASSLQSSENVVSDETVESSVDASAGVDDMSCDSDTEYQSEVAADTVNSTFMLTSPSSLSASANTERQTSVNNLTSSVTRVHKASHIESDLPSSLPSGIHGLNFVMNHWFDASWGDLWCLYAGKRGKVKEISLSVNRWWNYRRKFDTTFFLRRSVYFQKIYDPSQY